MSKWLTVGALAVWVLVIVVARRVGVIDVVRRPWQVWLPGVLAAAVIAGGLISGDWWLAGVFAVVMLVELWRTFPVWRRLSRSPPDQ